MDPARMSGYFTKQAEEVEERKSQTWFLVTSIVWRNVLEGITEFSGRTMLLRIEFFPI
jgi:hypothetical protein